MKNYASWFGAYAIYVKADNIEEATKKILSKWNGYKDGSTKKEYIRVKINNGVYVCETKLIRGRYEPVENWR